MTKSLFPEWPSVEYWEKLRAEDDIRYQQKCSWIPSNKYTMGINIPITGIDHEKDY